MQTFLGYYNYLVGNPEKGAGFSLLPTYPFLRRVARSVYQLTLLFIKSFCKRFLRGLRNPSVYTALAQAYKFAILALKKRTILYRTSLKRLLTLAGFIPSSIEISPFSSSYGTPSNAIYDIGVILFHYRAIYIIIMGLALFLAIFVCLKIFHQRAYALYGW